MYVFAMSWGWVVALILAGIIALAVYVVYTKVLPVADAALDMGVSVLGGVVHTVQGVQHAASSFGGGAAGAIGAGMML